MQNARHMQIPLRAQDPHNIQKLCIPQALHGTTSSIALTTSQGTPLPLELEQQRLPTTSVVQKQVSLLRTMTLTLVVWEVTWTTETVALGVLACQCSLQHLRALLFNVRFFSCFGRFVCFPAVDQAKLLLC
jgi:hypothetical protein